MMNWNTKMNAKQRENLMNTNCIYGACRVDIEPNASEKTETGNDLVIVNLKVGSTEQDESYYETLAEKRMSLYCNSYNRGETTSIIHKHKYNVDNGKLEGDYWTSSYAWEKAKALDYPNLFYTLNLSSATAMLEAEQILHNSVRQWAKQFTNTPTKVVLHEGHPYKSDGSLDGRTNPYPLIGEEPTDESFIKKLNAEIEVLLIEAKKKELEKNDKALEKKKKEVFDLEVLFEQAREKINQISI